jgi:hypothetical protein
MLAPLFFFLPSMLKLAHDCQHKKAAAAISAAAARDYSRA